MNILVLGIGNDILGDDAVGLMAARRLEEEFGAEADVVEAPVAGFALLEYIEGYDKVLLLDAVITGHHSPGTIRELTKDDFGNIAASSPHYVGLPEVFGLAEQLDLHFPEEFRILAMEVENPFDFQENLSPPVDTAMPGFIGRAREILTEWTKPHQIKASGVFSY